MGDRVLSTPVQRSCGSLATAAAMSAVERPRPARKARTTSGLEGDLRWESFVEAFSACARVRPHMSTRYSSTTNQAQQRLQEEGCVVDINGLNPAVPI
uniref:Uncharacterized protein n=1 Tax=Aegilops tauschii TaxID=37682 RepID=R7WDK8_AEGTA